MQELVQFSWGVPSEGYRWIEAQLLINGTFEKRKRRLLSPGRPPSWRTYHPLREAPALFRAFADVSPSESGVLAFADQYGSLGLDSDLGIDGDGSVTHSRGELLADWKREIIGMKHTLRIWDAVRSEATDDLARWFHLKREQMFSSILYKPDEGWPLGVEHLVPQYVEDERSRFRFLPIGSAIHRGDPNTSGVEIPEHPVAMALAYLRDSLNARIQKHVGVSLEAAADRTRLTPLDLYMIPKNLLGAMWLQLALAVEGDLRYQRCPQCKTWFKVPSKANRPSTTFCSPKCRVQAFRGRQAQARAMAARRVPLAKIADQLGSKVSVVRAWVSQGEKQPTRKKKSGRSAKATGRKP